VLVEARHVRAGDKSSPYEFDNGRITLKPVFRSWVFESFYTKFVQHVFEGLRKCDKRAIAAQHAIG